VCNDHELCVLLEFLKKADEAADIRLVERGVHLVENAEGRRLDEIDSEEKRQGCERSLPTRKKVDSLRPLPAWRRMDLDCGLEGVVGIGKPEVALASLEEALKGQTEIVSHCAERLGEETGCGLVDLPDRLPQVVPSLHEVLSLLGEEVESGALLLVLLNCEHIHRTDPLDRLDDLAQLRSKIFLHSINRISLSGECLEAPPPLSL
jgi:hypothetical protein